MSQVYELSGVGLRHPTWKGDRAMDIQIRFDGPPGPVPGRFIEVETLNGRSIKVGEWIQDGSDWLLKLDINLTERDRVK